MRAVLADFRRQFTAAAAEAAALADGLSEAQLGWRPAPDRWSIAECLAHLVATAEATLPNLDAAMAAAPRGGAAAESPYRPGWLARLLTWMMEPPHRIRMKTQEVFAPVEGGPRSAVERFASTQAALIARVEAAEGLDLNQVRAPSAANAKMKLGLGEWFAFLAAHQRRHLAQASRVRQAAGFPAG